jgi:hypothetical protein
MYSKKPTVFHINNFSRFPVYRIDFGSGKPKVVIPSDLANPIFIWNAPPQKDGVEVYFSGTLACTIARLKESDPWMKEMQQYSL